MSEGGRQLTSVPMKKRLAAEHRCELLGDAFEEFLDGGRVGQESGRHLEASRWNVAHGSLDVVGDPFNEVTAVLVLHVQHLLVHFLQW